MRLSVAWYKEALNGKRRDALIPRKGNHVCFGYATDGRDGFLNCASPLVDIWHIVGLVHQTEDDLVIASVFRCELRPKVGKLCVGRSSLSDDLSIPACI